MDRDRRRALSTSFAVGGAGYDRLRPGYPSAAVDWLTEDVNPGAPVADIGAGTGKLSRSLLERGFDITAVDPSADMLGQLVSSGVRCRIGTGEATGLPDRSVALATFAQSWHWVEREAGCVELARVLVPGGRAGWVWNFVDTRIDWVRRLREIWHSLTGGEVTDPASQAPEPTGAWWPVESIVVDWSVPMTILDLTALVTTRSYYLSASEADQLAVRKRAETFLHNKFGAAATVELPYRTAVYRAALQ